MKMLRFNTHYIDDYIKQNKITKKEFCARCGITLKMLDGIYKQRNVTIEKVYYILVVLNIPTNLFLVKRLTNKRSNF